MVLVGILATVATAASAIAPLATAATANAPLAIRRPAA
jgi:hypothetical protein